MISEFISQNYSFPLKKPFAKTALLEFAKWYLEAHGGLWWKGNILRYRLERSFLRNRFVYCAFISQYYNFPLQKPFAKTVLVEFAKGYLEALRALWWKRKYPHMKTGNKLSEKLLCDVWLPLTELQLYFVELFAGLISVDSENWYFGSLGRL